MSTTTNTTNFPAAGRAPKPRAFVMPVVRPMPPRPVGIGSDGIW